MDPIRLGQVCVYLTSSGPTQGHFGLRIRAILAEALAAWEPSTRLSPVWPIVGVGDTNFLALPAGITFTGHVLFIGPHRAHDTIQDVLLRNARLKQVKHLCLTLGLYNIVAFLTPATDMARIKGAAEAAGANWEHWILARGQITEVTSSTRDLSRDWVAPLSELAAEANWPHPLRGAMEEYLPLMASALARSESALPTLTGKLVKSMKVVKDVVNESEPNAYLQQSQVTHLNAALSRLSSQMFSGVSPILATECHYWIHSLLGTGTANLGLHSLAMFIQAKMGEYRLPDRIAALAEKTTPPLPIFSTLSPSDPAATKHYLDEAQFVADKEELIPLISYFSGRDGFKSNTTVISVPLSTITNANATPWTLQTLSHEVSHIIIEAVLGILLPDEDAALKHILHLMKTPAGAQNWLDALTSHVARAFLSLHATERKVVAKQLNLMPNDLREVIKYEIRDVTEVMVHVFDFMYFYNSEPEAYVRGIWTSWSAIPQISDRISEYVIRTICAICSKHLTHPKAEESALNQVRQILDGMSASAAYAPNAVAYIDSHKSEIEQAIVGRLPFIQFVRSFLYSPTLAGTLQADSLSSGPPSRSGGYEMRRGELSEQRIANPLSFVAAFTRDETPVPAESLVLWQVLAFGLAPMTASPESQ
ncbi:MAG: hypothetical protein V4864_14670 [Pseudomonadota bacterium]